MNGFNVPNLKDGEEYEIPVRKRENKSSKKKKKNNETKNE
jgi:hypothetical protein